MKKMKTFAYRLLALAGCLMALMLGGCVKNEFNIDFEFPKDHIGNYLISYYAWDKRGGRWIEHTASVQDGMATAHGVTRLPTIVYISDASSPSNSMMVYVERGDRIKVTGEGRDMASWTVKGNKLSERWSEWRKTAYPKKNDAKAFRKSIEEYVGKNPKDELSAILLLMEWNRREDPEGFVRLWNSIDRDARGNQLVEMCGAADMLGVEFTATADGDLEYARDSKVKSLVLRSRDNGTDSLRFDRPAILYFYFNNDNARRDALDSLKALSRSYPDSSRRIIADIYMDSDSLTWINAIRRDSLKGAVRAWQPRGVIEDDMVSMGVVRVPWFIVKDKDAKEAYTGDDLAEAVTAFRKLAGKPDPKAATKAKEDSKPDQESKDAEKPVQKTKALEMPAQKRQLSKKARDSRTIQKSDR